MADNFELQPLDHGSSKHHREGNSWSVTPELSKFEEGNLKGRT